MKKNQILSRRLLAASLILLLSTSTGSAAFGASADEKPGFSNFSRKQDYTVGHFTDVKSSDWYAPGVQSVYELGLMNGRNASRFAPKEKVKLCEAVSMAAKTRHIYNGGNGTLPKAEGSVHWYDDAVSYAIQQGIIAAEDFSDYEAEATRGQLAHIYAAAIPAGSLEPVNTLWGLPDVTEATPYAPDIFSLYQAGIVSGTDKLGTFRPDEAITRGEASSILSRVAVPGKRQSFSLTPLTGADLGPYVSYTTYPDRSNTFSVKGIGAWLAAAPGPAPDNALQLSLYNLPLEEGKPAKDGSIVGELIGYTALKENASAPLTVFHRLTAESIAKTLTAAPPIPAVSLTLSDGSEACISAFLSGTEENARYWVLTADQGSRFLILVGRTAADETASLQNEMISVMKSLSATK